MYNGILNIHNTTMVPIRHMTEGSPAPIYKHYVLTKHSLNLEDGTNRLSETSATNYVAALHNIPEERGPQLHCGRILKSHMMVDFWHVCRIVKTVC
jgi:hypothetical protein